MLRFLVDVGLEANEVHQLQNLDNDILKELNGTGVCKSGRKRLASGEEIEFEVASWESPTRQAVRSFDNFSEVEELKDAGGVATRLDLLPADALATIASFLTFAEMSATAAASASFRRLLESDTFWLKETQRLEGAGILTDSFACVGHCRSEQHQQFCCTNPYARLFFQRLVGLYRAAPRPEDSSEGFESPVVDIDVELPASSKAGALFSSCLHSPVLPGRQRVFRFSHRRVRPGRYGLRLRSRKVQLNAQLNTSQLLEEAALAGIRISSHSMDRRNIQVLHIEHEISAVVQQERKPVEAILNSCAIVNLLQQDLNMPMDRWFYLDLGVLDLRHLACPCDVEVTLKVKRESLSGATVSLLELSNDLRRVFVYDHLFLKIKKFSHSGVK